MAHQSRRLSLKFLRRNQTSPEITEKAPQQGSLLSSTVAVTVLFSSAGLILIFAWISWLFIFNPDKIVWMNKFLPEWAQIPFGYSEHPHTLPEIQASIQAQKQTSGATLALDKNDNTFLLPVFQQRPNCQSDCEELVALRVYQLATDSEFQSKSNKYYRLATQLSVTGIDKSFVDSKVENDDSNLLPLTTIKGFDDDTPAPGVWLNLQGEYQKGSGAIAYGQILYYNPERSNLIQLLSWKSSNGESPKWQQVTGNDDKELILDQTVGLEPQLRVYQVKPTKLYLNPIQLDKISLKPPAIKDTAYQNAISIARSGLWTPALESLKSLQKQRKNALPTTAQAQVDFIRLHSEFTKAQAEKTWASPSEQVLADLIDGRWNKALKVFKASPQNVQEISILLKGEKGKLWNRVASALEVNPQQPDVLTWGALILAVQQGDASAIAWLEKQPKISKDTIAEIQDLLKRLNHESEQ
ncbi:hypothetical protein H6G74_03205 [Nostoc spongiaeforme FACHB-130]|uniref:Uncharacterized protein n=1 Tax=Nostoc spongiaeforme FACHB-130 TaxID=1357510 RepID=A0ABR8FSM7_9NOSO|nr:hypothetical protein [Nostoc spongiaeforme]MBD2593335.1 hypothetical protein [Nostoc spongiaeforme FACHB-130]